MSKLRVRKDELAAAGAGPGAGGPGGGPQVGAAANGKPGIQVRAAASIMTPRFR